VSDDKNYQYDGEYDNKPPGHRVAHDDHTRVLAKLQAAEVKLKERGDRIAVLEAELDDVRAALNRETALTGRLAREKAKLCEQIASLRDGDGCNCAPYHMADCPVRENGGGK